MKRSADREPAKAKKQKTSHNGHQKANSNPEEQNFQPILRRSFQYLVGRLKVEKPPGHVQGIVKMIYPPAPGKDRFTLELAEIPLPVEHSTKKQPNPPQPSPFLEVMLSKLHLENLDPLATGTKVKLSLKGARIESLGTRKTVLPVRLVFTEGYHLRFGKNEVVDINTFKAPPASRPVEQKHEQIARALTPPLLPRDTHSSNDISHAGERRRPMEDVLLQDVKAECLTQPLPSATQAPNPDQEHVTSASTSNLATPMKGRSVGQAEAKSSSHTALTVPRGFVELNNLSQSSSRGTVIGVVQRSRPARECSRGDKDWMKSLQIADSSLPGGVGVNLFSGRDCPREHDINPEEGDIVILADLKVVKGRGTPLVGSSGYYHWAICSKKTKRIYWTDLGKMSPPVAVEGRYSPFYEPTPDVVAYCQQLLDWWKSEGANACDRSKNYVVASQHSSWGRRHRLVSELRLPAPTPNESYFDCTVEVLRFFENNCPPHTLWVTDYTSNDQCFNPVADWCPSGLGPYAFRIECWDESIQAAQELQENVFCRIENCRFMTSNSGYLEGKQCEAKIYQLAETSDNEHLKAMIQRKKTWQTQTGHVETKYEDGLLKDAVLDRFLNCTVEILHHEYSDAQKTGTVFCTDYTTRNDTGGVPKNAPWTEGLDRNEIVKIVLSGGQAPVANMVKRGDYCRFSKMRLKVDHIHRYTVGFLGGNQSLMDKLNPKNKENETLQALLRRKEVLGVSKLTKTFKDILHSNRFPSQYKVVGRVVGQEPKILDEAVTLWCSKCDRELKSREKMCIGCELDDDLVPRCNLFLSLEDKERGRVLAHVPETSFILDGIDLSRFLDDRAIRDAFKQRIRALSGNSPTKSDAADAKGPSLVLDVRVWLDQVRDVGFVLMGATPSPI